MAIYTVIDTNVLISALLSKHADSATVILIEKMFLGELIPVYDTDVLREYREVLNRKKFKFDSEQINTLLLAISYFGLLLEPSPTGELLPDMKDLPFYEVVIDKRKTSEAYLVTGNKKHFPVKPFIVDPREMLDILSKAK